MNRFEAAPEAAMLPVEDVVDLQNLIMGGIRQQQSLRGRRVHREDDPRTYLFCMLDASDDVPSDNTGTIDTYLSVKLAKQHTRHWRMLISFLEGRNTEADALTNSRTLYQMDWTRTEAQGVTWNIETIAGADSTALLREITSDEAETSLLLGNSVQRVSSIQYMQPDDINAVRNRVQEVSDGVTLSFEREFERRMRRRLAIL